MAANRFCPLAIPNLCSYEALKLDLKDNNKVNIFVNFSHIPVV